MSVFYVCVACCQVEVSATGISLVQRSPIECGGSKCDSKASTTRRSWHTRGLFNLGGGEITFKVEVHWTTR